ncbi:hypothetical protein DFQ59_102589 [Thioalbus denitrificans]|uniref:Uncharacterized protein n=1 Tax=Thioalbus denitrificans TaxID=547122 RepID=A0A369CE97_9GAMM|nr:hypothetical protein DFQ59_102589 [Thioalbus denitrificans]
MPHRPGGGPPTGFGRALVSVQMNLHLRGWRVVPDRGVGGSPPRRSAILARWARPRSGRTPPVGAPSWRDGHGPGPGAPPVGAPSWRDGHGPGPGTPPVGAPSWRDGRCGQLRSRLEAAPTVVGGAGRFAAGSRSYDERWCVQMNLHLSGGAPPPRSSATQLSGIRISAPGQTSRNPSARAALAPASPCTSRISAGLRRMRRTKRTRSSRSAWAE